MNNDGTVRRDYWSYACVCYNLCREGEEK